MGRRPAGTGTEHFKLLRTLPMPLIPLILALVIFVGKVIDR